MFLEVIGTLYAEQHTHVRALKSFPEPKLERTIRENYRGSRHINISSSVDISF